MLLYGKKETNEFSETIIVSDIKVGRCIQTHECMMLYEFKRHGHSMILVQGHLDSTLSNVFLRTATPIEANLYLKPPWDKDKWLMSHDQNGRHVHIW